jgi:hypothetical protein
MDCRYGDKVKNEDIIEEYRNFYGDIENWYYEKITGIEVRVKKYLTRCEKDVIIK